MNWGIYNPENWAGAGDYIGHSCPHILVFSAGEVGALELRPRLLHPGSYAVEWTNGEIYSYPNWILKENGVWFWNSRLKVHDEIADLNI